MSLRLRTSTPRLRRIFVALALLLAMLSAACSSAENEVTAASDAASDESGITWFEDAEPVTESAPQDWAADDADASEGRLSDDDTFGLTGAAGGGESAQAQLPDLGRDIIFTARLDLAATDVSAATRDAIRAIESRGGFLFSQETSAGSSVLTFKVLPEQFQAALNDLGSVGTVRSQSISADDVTAVVVDLESRINTAEASVTRLRNLLDEARELETIATLENQLLQRETTLEQLRGQLRTVRSQVDLATITVSVSELLNRPGLAISTAAYPGHDGGFGCFDNVSIRSAEAGDPITLCYLVTNTGDTPLVNMTLDDPALGATIGSLVVVDGTASQIDPGETLVLAHETELSESVRVRTAVTATGIDADGNSIDEEVKATAPSMRFDVLVVDDGFPSFGEVLSNSWNALVTVAIVIALVAVALAPFVAVGLLVGLPLLWLFRRNRSRRPLPAPPIAPPVAPDAEQMDPADATLTDASSTTS